MWDASALLWRFIYAPGASTPFLVVERATGGKTFLHADRLGSIIATANNNGAITGQAKYSPYGVTAGSIPTIFGYTGHQYDAEIGLYYARARTYMPLLGRFMQVDPVGYKQSLNLYTYGLGNPIAHTDPSGAFIIPLAIAAVQLIVGELTASAFISTVIEIALSEAVTRLADSVHPGLGAVLSVVSTLTGLSISPAFSAAAPGKIEKVAANIAAATGSHAVSYTPQFAEYLRSLGGHAQVEFTSFLYETQDEAAKAAVSLAQRFNKILGPDREWGGSIHDFGNGGFQFSIQKGSIHEAVNITTFKGTRALWHIHPDNMPLLSYNGKGADSDWLGMQATNTPEKVAERGYVRGAYLGYYTGNTIRYWGSFPKYNETLVERSARFVK